MPNAFVTDTIINENTVTLFRLGSVNFPDPSRVTTPWGEARSLGAYEEGGGVVDFPGVGHALRSELLRGYVAGRVKPIIGSTVARYLPSELLKRFESAVDALMRGGHFHFQPVDCHAPVELKPKWVQLRRNGSAVSIAIVGDRVQRVGTADINALVWKTGDALWSIGHVTPDN